MAWRYFYEIMMVEGGVREKIGDDDGGREGEGKEEEGIG